MRKLIEIALLIAAVVLLAVNVVQIATNLDNEVELNRLKRENLMLEIELLKIKLGKETTK